MFCLVGEDDGAWSPWSDKKVFGRRQGYKIMPCPDGDFHVTPWRLSFYLISMDLQEGDSCFIN